MPIAREGLWFIVPPTVLGLALLLRHPAIGATLLVIGALCAYFFRDPERRIPDQAGIVVSPADGRIVRITALRDGVQPAEAGMRVSIFMSIFDVHVNRAPIAGRVKSIEYRSGAFLPAFDHAASERNERNMVTLESDATRVAFTQIAGIIARRIVFRKRIGEDVKRGERIGLICFGSRVDLALPAGTRILVSQGDRVRAGESIMAEIPASDGRGSASAQ